MDPTIITFLMVAIGLAAQGYFFGFLNPTRVLVRLEKAIFFLMTFLVVPLLGVLLFFQAGATHRLADTGVVPHPGLQHAVGLAVGRGTHPTWVFTAGETVSGNLAFYHDPAHRSGWRILSEDEDSLVMARGPERMTIAVRDRGASRALVYKTGP